MRRSQCPAEVRTLQNVFKAQEDDKNPNVTKMFFQYYVERVENHQQSHRKVLNSGKHSINIFFRSKKKPSYTCVSRNGEKENEMSSLSAVIGENFKQYLRIIFRLFLSLSKAANGHVSGILSPVISKCQMGSSPGKRLLSTAGQFSRK